jgi:hypothetical protein
MTRYLNWHRLPGLAALTSELELAFRDDLSD